MPLFSGAIQLFKKLREYEILLFGLFLVALPLIVVGIYNHPAASDYFYQMAAIREQGYFGALNWFYNTNMGRFFTLWILFFYFQSLGFLGFKIIAPILIALLVATVYILTRTVIPKTVSRTSAITLTCTIMILYLGYMPSIMEGLFWTAGSLMYQVAAIMLLLFLFFLIAEKRTSKKSIKFLLRAITMIVLLLTVWSHEIVMIFALFLLASSCIYSFFKKKVIDTYYLALLFVGILASIPVIFAPGILMRQMRNQHIYDFTFTGIQTILYTGRELFSWIFSPALLLFTALWTPLCIEIKKHTKITVQIIANPLLCALLMLGMLLFSHAVSFWNIGFSPLRLQNILFLFFLLLWFYTSFTVVSMLVDRKSTILEAITKALLYRGVMSTLCIIAVLISLRSSHAIVAIRDLASGIAYRFDQELLARYEVIESAPKDQILVVEPLYNYPTSLFFGDITQDEKNWLNDYYARYFGIKGIKINSASAPPLPIVFKKTQF